MERPIGHMRPGPSQSLVHGKCYEKLSEFANISGQLYEIKMAALLFLRVVQTTHNFHLATNMKAAGSFDDVVLSHGDQTVFLQLKHRKNSSKIRTSQLIQLGGDFSLLKYCSSYFKVKQQWEQNVDLKLCNRLENSLFIVYTDVSMVEAVGTEVGNTQLYNVIDSGGKCIQFTEENDKEIFNIFNNLDRYKQLLTTGEDITNSSELLDAVQKLHNHNAKSIPSKKELTKLLKDLDSLGDLSGFREFLSRLRFCTEQAAERHLDSLIKHELKVVFGTVSVFERFIAEVQNWWRNSREFLTQKIEFWQDIVQLCIANLSESTLNQILNIGINFNTEEIDRIRALMSSSGRILHVISNFSILSTSKFQQGLRIKLLVDGNKLLTKNVNEVVAAWVLGEWNEVLLVTGELKNQNVVTRLIEILKQYPGKRLVLMTSESEKIALNFSQAFEFGTCIDTFSLKQLDVEYQEKVLAGEVEFQGFIVPLKLLVEESALERILTSDVVIQLLLKNKVPIGEKFNEIGECYIERKFLRKEIINSKDLFGAKVMCLAISGISCEDLKEMLSPREYVVEFEILKNVEINDEVFCIVIKDTEDFNVLSERYKEVHWFYYCEGSFKWRKSKGDLKIMKSKDSATDLVEYSGVKEINVLPNKFVLITAEPGMGKSTELSHVALQMKQDDPSTCVVMVNLNDHTDYLAQEKPSARELLLRAGNFKTAFEKALFRHYLDEGNNTIVLIDSFDEISPMYSEVVYKILGELSDMNIKTVWVASRPVMKEHLEEKLCTLSFCLKSFTECEQKEYFLKLWKAPSYYVNNLETFIQKFFELISECLNDRFKEFTGIPLQTKMLAEVFKDEFRHYCDTGKVLLPQKLNLLQLYHRFIETKWRIFYEKYNLNVTNVAMHKTYQNLRAKLEQGHMICGLVSLLSDKELEQIQSLESINKKYEKFVKKFLEGDERTGIIVNITNGKAVFVHRTFMEYFVAMWLYNNWKCNSHVIRRLYFDGNFQVVRRFFDRFLAKKCELHVAVMNRDKALVDYLLSQKEVNINDTDEGGRTALHLAVMNFIDDYYDMELNGITVDILTELVDNGADCNKVDNISNLQPVGLAEEIKAWYAVGLLLQKGAESTEQIESDEHIGNILELLKGPHLVKFMNSNGVDVEYKLTAGINYDIMNDRPCEGSIMIHLETPNSNLCIAASRFKDKVDINALSNDTSCGDFTPVENGKKKARESLMVEIKDACKYKALHMIIDCEHYHTMKFLIEHKADVKIHGNAVIHSVACSGNVGVASYIFNAGLFIDIRNIHLETLVLTAIRNKN